jgi:hypothetical protein
MFPTGRATHRANGDMSRPFLRTKKEIKGAAMNIFVSLGPIAALIAGILILIVPRLLNYIVALYLIIIGLLGLLGPGAHSLHL